ncbi:MAG: type IV toxin-antitoxin system AbiEi family antitoxin [Pseudomonadota bacterium]|nr:type IV toxin-antitoxin system AbiEi family antitoxin [Pseudomonadota bacterium]MDE3037559.1 type IV toxin-antitoxin system AbiEi family antitoxin [Pseudomonadota bacterium]
MSTVEQTKINQLLATMPPGTVVLSSWLARQGYSVDLQKRYRKSRWLESIGDGAMVRTGESVDYSGALYALQKQAGLYVHAGGRTALSLLGKAHYLQLAPAWAVLFGGKGEVLPKWFRNHDWKTAIEYHATSFLPGDLGLEDFEVKNFSIKISSVARAMMECLYLAPQKQELLECLELMEGLNNLRPALVQQLLEQCASIKVKRLFLYLAEKAGHEWLQHLDLQKIDLGKGKRSLVKNGIYVPKYQITVPKELASHDR